MPEEIIKKRAEELREQREGITASPPITPRGKVKKLEKATQKSTEIPVGKLKEESGYKMVVSSESHQEQWIPKDASRFKDIITGEVEAVK